MAADALASLLLDRFVSASSAEDAHTSLERILEALQANNKKTSNKDGDADETKLPPEFIWSDPEILSALRHVLHTGQHKHQDMEVPVEEGASLVCRIYMEMLSQETTKSPLLEKDESLLECLIDVISSDGETKDDQNDNTNNDDAGAGTVSMYTRVLGLQLLTKLCVNRPSKAQAQLLQAPNGLHRLGDLLQVHQEEIIRNEALLLAQVIAEWPSCAKIWMFSEVGDQVMLLTLEEGGLTGGNLLVQDCLDLLFKLWKHDPNLADLVFQSPTISNILPRLLDLRQGTEFLHPPSKKKPAAKKEDDLDDILKSASSNDAEPKEDAVVIPKLTAAEEKVIRKTLDIVALLLGNDAMKKSVWTRQIGLCSLMWELALVSPPPPHVPFVCAVPSPQLQQKALETTALYFHDTATMERHAGLDRLLYLVCTGGLGTTLEEKMGISQAALHVIRRTVSVESANEMLMYTLAPPMTMGDVDENGMPRSPPPTVVHKLLNTVAENLTVTPGIDPERRKIFLAGALGGLSIFLSDQTSREVMLRLTTTRTKSGEPFTEDDLEDETDDANIITTSLSESILHAVGSMQEAQNPEDAFLSMTLLRFLCHWTIETPTVVQTILSSNQSSIVLSALLGIKRKTDGHKKGVAVLGKLLLGLCMEYMGDDEAKCGGWTRESIMELIAKKSGGVSKFTSSLEQFKSVKDFGDIMPWSVCDLEFKVWSQWFSRCVLLVRKRVVQELTGNAEGDDDDDDDDEDGPLQAGDNMRDASGGNSARSMQKLVFQQSQEIEELQQLLKAANTRLVSQQHELSEYKRRVESAPSQLDNMLNEYSAKINELKSRAVTLEDEKSVQEKKYMSELESRDEQIAALQKELEESRTREKESRDETETLREEIQSLSEAYNSLEQEYRNQQQRQVISSSTTTTASEQQPGEQEEEGSQQQRTQQQAWNSSAGVGSTEISALRAENERLRSDAQAADQWMAMAVEKMKTMGQQNATLQAELANLRASQSQDLNEQQRALQQQNQALFEEKQSLVHQLNQLQSALDNSARENQHLQQSMQDENNRFQELERQLSNAKDELASTVSEVEESRSRASVDNSEYERKLEVMTRDLEKALAELNQLRDQVYHQQRQLQQQSGDQEQEAQGIAHATARLEADLAVKDDEIRHLRTELESQATELRAENQQLTDERTNLQSSLETLQNDVQASRSELEHVRRHDQEEIYKRESRIRELEARINTVSGGQGGYTAADIKERDDEIAELRAANEAAQDWMSKAVNHHKMLSEQHAQLGAENAELHAQLRELKEKVSQNDATVARTRVLEQESSLLSSRLKEVEASSQAYESELKRLQSELALSKSLADDLARATNEINTLQASLQEQIAACEELGSELSAERDAKASLAEELRLLKSNFDDAHDGAGEIRDQVDKLQQQVDTLSASLAASSSACEELRNELSTERNAKENVQRELESLKMESEKESSGLQLLLSKSEDSNDERKISELFVQLEKVKDDNAELIRSQNEDKDAIRRLNEEIQSLRLAKERTLTAPVSQPASIGMAAQNLCTNGASARTTQDTVPLGHASFGGESTDAFFGASSGGGSATASIGSAQDFFGAAPALSGGISPGSAQDFFGAAPAPAGGSAQDFFGAASAPVGGGAQDSFGAAPAPNVEGTQIYFRAGQPTSDGDGHSRAGGEEGQLRNQLADKTREIEDLETRLRNVSAELDNLRKATIENQSSAHDRIKELETQIGNLQQQVEQKEDISKQHLISVGQDSASSGLEIAQPADGDVRKELERIKKSLADAEAKVKDGEDVVLKWEERAAELETNVQELELQLAEQEETANTSIAKWQETCTTLEERNAELIQSLEASAGGQTSNQETVVALRMDLEKTKASLAAAEAKLAEDDQIIVKWEERVAELESTVKDMEVQLTEQEEHATTAISRWQESCNSLEEKNAELLRSLESFGGNDEDVSPEAFAALRTLLEERERALADAEANRRDDGDVVLRWQERVAELELALKDAEEQLKNQEEEAHTVVTQWEQNCTALDQKNAELVVENEALKTDNDKLKLEAQDNQETSSNLKRQISVVEEELSNVKALQADTEGKLSTCKEQLAEAERALNEAKEKLKDDEDVVMKWQEQVSALESEVKDLEAQMSEQEVEAEKAISEWQDSFNKMQEKNDELVHEMEASRSSEQASQKSIMKLEEKLKQVEQELTNASAARTEAEEALSKIRTQLSEAQGELAEARTKLTEDEVGIVKWQEHVADLEAQMNEQEEEANAAIAQWQESCNKLQEKNSELVSALEASAADKEAVSHEVYSTVQTQLKETEAALAVATTNARALETQLTEREASMAEWQVTCASLEGENEELLSSLEAMRSELADTKKILSGAEIKFAEADERVAGLEVTVQDLEQQLTEKDVEANSVIVQWQETVTALEATKVELTESLQEATAHQECTQNELTSLRAKLNAMENDLASSAAAAKAEHAATIAKLEKDLKEQQEESKNASILFEAKIAELSQSLDKTKAQNEELQSFREKIPSLESQLSDASEKLADDEKVLSEWEKRVADLEAATSELEERLSEQETEASDAISMWQERCTELEKANTELTQSLEAAFNRSMELTDENDSLALFQAQLTETEAALAEEKRKSSDWNEQVTELESMVNALQQRLLDNEKEARAAREQLEQTLSETESKRLEATNALDEARTTIDALEKLEAERNAKIDLLAKAKENGNDKICDIQSSLEEAQASLLAERETVLNVQNLLKVAEDKAAALEVQVQGVQDQLRQKEQELANAIAEWQQHCSMLDKQNKELSKQLLKASNKATKSETATEWSEDDADSEWNKDDPDFEDGAEEERVAELELTIKSLEEELEENEKEAAEVVAHWAESYGALEGRNGQLEVENAMLEEELRSLQEIKESLTAEMNELAQSQVSEFKAKVVKLESRAAMLEEELSELSSQLVEVTKERDEALAAQNDTASDQDLSVESLSENLYDSASKLEDLAQSKEKDDAETRELSAKVQQLEGQIRELLTERDSMEVARESLESKVKDLEQTTEQQEDIVRQWTERSNELDVIVQDLEEQLETQVKDANEAIASCDARCTELNGTLNESRAELQNWKTKMIEMLSAELGLINKLLSTYEESFDGGDIAEDDDENAGGVDSLWSILTDRNSALEGLVARQNGDIEILHEELERYKSEMREPSAVESGDGVPSPTLAVEESLKAQITDLQKDILDARTCMNELQSTIDGLQISIASERQAVKHLEERCRQFEADAEVEKLSKESVEAELEKVKTDLAAALSAEKEAKAELEQAVLEQEELRDSLSAEEGELQKLSDSLAAEKNAKAELERSILEQEELRDSVSSEKGEVEKLQQSLAEALEAEKKVRSQLEKLTAENKSLQETLASTKSLLERKQEHDLKLECDGLKYEKQTLQLEVDRLSSLSSQLEEELHEANNALQVYIAKEVSDKATEMATRALRQQLHEIRNQSDADRAAYLAEREKKIEALNEVDRLRTDLLALVDVTEQENELYGKDALMMKAADKIHKKERSEIAELRNSLARALNELRESRTAEKDAEERAAKAAHHVVVCEQELASTKSDMRYLIQTMDEMRQDESSRRASMEHRIRSLENDLEVLRRFHSSETDSLRNELTQAVMDKDRTIQLLKDSEKNNAAMLYAASRDNGTNNTNESSAAELEKLRIEKAQLLIAAAEEGARTERRLREVIATGLSSAEADVLVEREKRLAAEAAFDNMKLVNAELQSELQALRIETRVGRSPSKVQIERENERIKQEIERLAEENSSLRKKLESADIAQESANYRIEKLTAECQMAQAASNRLDREIKFRTEMQAEMSRLRPSPQPKMPLDDETARDRASEAQALNVELYETVHQQAEAIQKEREVHREVKEENEELLALLAQQEVIQKTLQRALAKAGGPMAVDAAIREAQENTVAQYGSCVEIVNLRVLS